MLTITTQDGKNWNNEVENRWAKAIRGDYGSESARDTKITRFGPFVFWRCQGSGSMSIEIPSSSESYAATIFYDIRQGQSCSASTGLLKSVAIAPKQTQLNVDLENAWIVQGLIVKDLDV